MHRFAAVLLLATLSLGCTKKPAPKRCFDVTVATTSKTSREVFAKAGCQGGGVTWAAILTTLADREGPSTATAGEEWTGDVRAREGGIFSIDEEGDASRFCSNEPAFLARIESEWKRINADPAALRAVMKDTSAEEMECEGD
ncbi:MAG: hypothetical protein U0228_31255 [Myxococcaceae bacterium]